MTQRRQTALLILIIASSILAIASAVAMLSIVFGVSDVDGNTGARQCGVGQHLIVDPTNGEGDCFWDSK